MGAGEYKLEAQASGSGRSAPLACASSLYSRLHSLVLRACIVPIAPPQYKLAPPCIPPLSVLAGKRPDRRPDLPRVANSWPGSPSAGAVHSPLYLCARLLFENLTDIRWPLPGALSARGGFCAISRYAATTCSERFLISHLNRCTIMAYSQESPSAGAAYFGGNASCKALLNNDLQYAHPQHWLFFGPRKPRKNSEGVLWQRVTKSDFGPFRHLGREAVRRRST